MNRFIVVGLFVSGLACAGAEAQQDKKNAAKFGWQFDYRKAKALAKQSNKPMLIVFRCVP